MVFAKLVLANSMQKNLIILLCLVSFDSMAIHLSDSVNRQLPRWVFTPRFNTLNMAPVSGNIVNRHVNFDFSLIYTKSRFMWTVADGVDLEDFHSTMNYFLTNVRYKISLTRKLYVSPFLAFYSEHTQQLFDPVSDANGGMLFTFQQGFLTVEVFALMVRLTHSQTQQDFINRFELRYNLERIVFSIFMYQNTEYFDGKKSLALGFKTTLPEFKIANKVNARAEVTGSFKIQDSPEKKNVSGVFLFLEFTFLN